MQEACYPLTCFGRNVAVTQKQGAGGTTKPLRGLQLSQVTTTAALVLLVKMEVILVIVRTSYAVSYWGQKGIITLGTFLSCPDSCFGLSSHFRDNEDT